MVWGRELPSEWEPASTVNLAQVIASILESRDEQTELLWQLVANSTRGGNGARNAPTTYSDFLATHPPLFTEAGEHLEADHWLQVMECKFGLLRCTEVPPSSSAPPKYQMMYHHGSTYPP
jgi:hypothetical protein